MNHESAQDLLLDLSYGELGSDEAREVERHVAACAECAAEWHRLTSTRRAMARLADEPRADARRAAILEAASAGAGTPPRRRSRRSTLWTIGATAAVATIVGGVTLKLSGERPLDHVATVAPRESASAPAAAPPAARDEAAEVHEPPSKAAAPERRSVARAPASGAARVPRSDTAARREEGPEQRSVAAAPLGDAPRVAGSGAARATREQAPEAREDASPVAPEQRARADAAEKRAASAAPTAAPYGIRTEAPADRAAESRALVAAVERRLAARELAESSRRLTCGGTPVDQVSWAEGARVVKVAIRAPGGDQVAGWYDGEGRLRAMRAIQSGAALDRLLDPDGRVVHEERSGTLRVDVTRWLATHEPRAACGD